MALIVENGTGVSDAESLASVAFADLYHSNRGNLLWATFDLATKEQLLRKATDYTALTYAGFWDGELIAPTQSLPFPRLVNKQNIGLPVYVSQGVCELALIAKTTPLTPNVVRGKKRVKIGSLEVEYDGNNSSATKFISASLRFAPYLKQIVSGAMAKLVRT